MKYIVCEGTPNGEYNASSKARNDILEISKRLGYAPLYVPTEYGVQTKKWKKPLQLYTYNQNKKTWLDEINKLEPGDTILVQYPLLNTTTGFDQVLKAAKEKGVETIAAIHDMDSLRFTAENSTVHVVNRVNKEDNTYLPLFSKVIAHNETMANLLKERGCENVVPLQVFDYLYEGKPARQAEGIVIAGNLDPVKANYLGQLDRLNVDFNLYGVGYQDTGARNIRYKGKFPPDELIEHLEGKFGLVWDGNSLDSCESGFGSYQKYNNPHKLSLYLAAGLPVIVWDKAATAKFVEENNVGLAVSSLHDLEQKLMQLSEADYEQLRNNVRTVGEKVRHGSHFQAAVDF